MFGMGMQELLLILVVALIVVGPKKLPDMAKTMGKALQEFRRATSDFKESLEVEYNLKDTKKTFEDVEKEIRKTGDPAPTVPKNLKPEPAVKDTDGQHPRPVSNDEDDLLMAGTDLPVELLVSSDENNPADSLAEKEKGRAAHVG